jgi:FkbM family methyltransferase
MDSRTEEFYKRQYRIFLKKYSVPGKHSLRIGDIVLPLLSDEKTPTREEAYYAMEIGDILLPSLFRNYRYVDEGPYEWGSVSVRSGDVVFDCGAHLGIFSVLAAYRGAEVYAFEPIQEAGQSLRRTLAANPLLAKHIRIIPCALSDREGTAEFTVLDGTLVGSSMVLPQMGRKVCVNVTTIDRFTEESGAVPSFLKADIEGAERLMLAGAQDTLAECAPKVAVCTYHQPDDPQTIENLLLQGNPDYHLEHKWKKVYGSVP